jgi:hypothetical protein
VLLAIWSSSYVFNRRIPILLLNKGEAAVFQIPILLKALFVSGTQSEIPNPKFQIPVCFNQKNSYFPFAKE